jgi:hypothetical protein
MIENLIQASRRRQQSLCLRHTNETFMAILEAEQTTTSEFASDRRKIREVK